jgi:hypothetical protein
MKDGLSIESILEKRSAKRLRKTHVLLWITISLLIPILFVFEVIIV